MTLLKMWPIYNPNQTLLYLNNETKIFIIPIQKIYNCVVICGPSIKNVQHKIVFQYKLKILFFFNMVGIYSTSPQMKWQTHDVVIRINSGWVICHKDSSQELSMYMLESVPM